MKDKSWIPRSEKPSDKLSFDFKQFFNDYSDHNLDEIAQILNYSVAGVEKMVLRGTIKRKAYNKLSKTLMIDLKTYMKGRV